MRPDLPPYFWSRWLTRSIKAVPSGLWATRPTSSAMTFVSPRMAACMAR